MRVCHVQHYEGQAAMELEALVGTPRVEPNGWRVVSGVLDLKSLMQRIAQPNLHAVIGAELFHGTLAAALADWAGDAANKTGISSVALGGGCFLNRVLTETLVPMLRARGLVPLLARAVPPNDGGLSLGQAWVAASALRDGG
jgi:hydrogenase maturation protein HypF